MAAEALIAAVENSSIQELKQLLDEGAEINSKVDHSGWTALHCAVQNKKEEIVHFLLERGADPHIKKGNGATPFIVAGMVGSVELLQLFLSKGSDINEHDVNGFTALMETSCYGKEDALRFLYSCGADVNLGREVDEERRALNKGGATALMDAARNCHIAIVKTLVEEMNADMHICDNQGRNALVHALSVTENKNWNGDKEAIALFLLKHRSDVNKRDEYGKTTLILATERQSQALVKAILEKDEVDINATDNSHKTALCFAVENKNLEIARLLCEHGARTDIENQNLIASARKLYDYEMIKLLQDFGAKAVSSQCQKQETIPSKRWALKLQHLLKNCISIGKLQIYKIDDFRIQGTSQGGVYLGFYDGEAVAVKIFRSGTENAEREKTCLEKCRISNHLVRFYGWEEKKACQYLCLSLCEQNLEEYFRMKENSEDTMKTKDILEGVFQAVQELHGFRFGHQDIHPRNILIDVTGKVFLADFDKCRKLVDDETNLIIKEDIKALERLVIYVAMRGESCFEDLPNECPEDVTDYKELEDLRANLSSFDVSEQVGYLMCHPYFWSKQMKYRFLREMGNESDIKTRNTKNENPDSELLKALNCKDNPFQDWTEKIHKEVLTSMEDPFQERDKKKKNRPKKVYENYVTDLLKLIRNVSEHFKEKEESVQEIIKNPEDYFLELFPDLPIYVYQKLRSTKYRKCFPHVQTYSL